MITRYDYFIIGCYLLFILGIGFVFRRQSKNTSDYFRAGGVMPWWITGTSAWIAAFSAWTFTGAAKQIYETGTVVLVLYYAGALAFAVVYLFTCQRFRRMRVVTWMEAVKLRFGTTSEQIYTWVKVPVLLFLSGISLNAIGVFISSVFHMEMNTTLIILGVVVTLVAFAGGAWAVLASDFVQMFMVVTITIVAAVLTLRRPEIGGLVHLLQTVQVPILPTHWSSVAAPFTLILWTVAISWMQITNSNNMENSVMYLMAGSDRDAKRMVLIPLIGSLIGPLIWIIPPLAATILHPHLGVEFPNLKKPNEAAFVAVCLQVLPQGLIGLLICAMLGATLTNMDAGLNKGVGVFIRSFYLPMINPKCSERKLLFLSKASTLAFGVLIVSFALLVNKFRTADLFTFVNQVAASLSIPLALPLFLGLFYKRTPPWSAWSTGLLGIIISLFINFYVKYHLSELVHRPLNHLEADNLLFAVTIFGTFFPCTAWFFFTTLFYESGPAEDRERVEEFFERLRTPVLTHATIKSETAIHHLLGLLCIVFGSFIILLMLIPNNLLGRSCFLFCGGSLLLTGSILEYLHQRHRD